MTTITPTATGSIVRPDPTRKAALIAGVLYLLTFLSSIPAVFLLEPVLSDPEFILGAGGDSQIVLGTLLDLVNAFACIGTAVALFSVVKRQNEGLALGFVTSRIMEAAIIVIGVVSLLAVVTLQQDGVGASAPASAVLVGQSLVAVRDWTFLLGPGLMPAFNALLLGTLLYRSRLVPRAIPLLGLIGAPLLISSTIGNMFGVNETVSVWSTIGTAPFFFWELSLGLWMTFKGFNRSAATALIREDLR
jgi:hypothetical protein